MLPFCEAVEFPGETLITIPNGNFARGLEGWTVIPNRGDVFVTDEDAVSGRHSLVITGTAQTRGARVDGPMVPCQGPGVVELRGNFRTLDHWQVGVHVLQYDAEGEWLSHTERFRQMQGSKQWGRMWHRIVLDERTTHLRLRFVAYPTGDNRVATYVDNLRFVRLPTRIPPGPSQYKLSSDDVERLTPADVLGPDGVVYPNWRHVGVDGGIPDVPVVVRLADLGAAPETDIAPLLQEAVEQVGEAGGGAVLIPEGVFYLNTPIVVRHSRVVIRGSGRDATRLVWRYSIANPDAKPANRDWNSVFMFLGEIERGHRIMLAADGRRGDTTLKLEEVDDLTVGDRFMLRTPLTERWRQIVGYRAGNHLWVRSTQYEIRSIDGNTISIGEPLRIDFPVEDGSLVQRTRPLEYCGLESMTIEHACRRPFDTLTSHWVWNCWARDLLVVAAGRSGVHFRLAKRCEVRDSEFIGFDPEVHRAHDNYFGYAGFTSSTDCLIENTVWHRFRHGPQVQFGAHGNVIRNSVFDGSDAQWHAGWSTENLYENCIIDARTGYGSYGHGAYATGSDDLIHGPNGPRNVVYNCDFSAPVNGVLLNGFNENWLFLHNRFVVERGAGFVATFESFDHIIKNNIFVLRNNDHPLLLLRTPDCVGIDLIGNTLYGGNGRIAAGPVEPALERDNRALEDPGEDLPPRPAASPASIYAWQNNLNE